MDWDTLLVEGVSRDKWRWGAEEEEHVEQIEKKSCLLSGANWELTNIMTTGCTRKSLIAVSFKLGLNVCLTLQGGFGE